jgi:hypothetical protein
MDDLFIPDDPMFFFLSYARLTAINLSFGCLNSSAPLAMASASLVASTSPSQTAFERRTKMDQRTKFVPTGFFANPLKPVTGANFRASCFGVSMEMGG